MKRNRRFKWPFRLKLTRRKKKLLLYVGLPVGLTMLAGLFVAVNFVVSVYPLVRIERDGVLFKFPSVVYSDWIEIKRGDFVDISHFVDVLNSSRYRKTNPDGPLQSGEYKTTPDTITIYTRSFHYPDGAYVGKPCSLTVENKKVTQIRDLGSGSSIDRLRIEPTILSTLTDDAKRVQYWVPIENIPPEVKNAIVATEDKNFFEHHGIDPFGILRALVVDIIHRRFEEGGSTITQQLVKNLFLTSRKTIGRKINEAVLTLMVEKKYTKEQILEAYLNLVYFGNAYGKNIYGVEAGARHYFGKTIDELSLAEAAMLAGIIRAPNYYSPVKQQERSEDVRDVVLKQMLKRGFITAQQCDAALKQQVSISRRQLAYAPYFVAYVEQQAHRRFSERDLYGGGLRIFTTLSAPLQSVAERNVSAQLSRFEKSGGNRSRLQVAVVSLDPKDGRIKCMLGGRDFGKSEFNRATQARRQIGSAVKPIITAVALDSPYRRGGKTYTTVSILNDRPASYRLADDTVWTPENHNGEYLGDITLRRAVAHSQNVAMVRLLEQLEPGLVIKYVEKMEVNCKPPRDLSLALGTMEASPLDLAKIYSVFASYGNRVEPKSIRYVVDKKGKVVYQESIKKKSVLHPATCYLVTDIMKSVFIEGTGISAQGLALEYPIAGKTGTTNDYTDAWFAGYSPTLVTTVWVGNDANKPIGLSGSQAALPIWTKIMEYSLTGAPRKEFSPPDGIEFASVDRETGMLATEFCTDIATEPFIKGTAPADYCSVHDKWRIVRSIRDMLFGSPKKQPERIDENPPEQPQPTKKFFGFGEGRKR
ncbi:PBP1A family penicillin-binding protein [Candidatus Poribacteria bacterium]|nr:PBP1A family penicillin-binding protein [Candidatus Poribacteria bacterium]